MARENKTRLSLAAALLGRADRGSDECGWEPAFSLLGEEG
jgi:hypothetical protein